MGESLLMEMGCEYAVAGVCAGTVVDRGETPRRIGADRGDDENTV
jgi:hypothetical protein